MLLVDYALILYYKQKSAFGMINPFKETHDLNVYGKPGNTSLSQLKKIRKIK